MTALPTGRFDTNCGRPITSACTTTGAGRIVCTALACVAVFLATSALVQAQTRTSAVGGVLISTDGMLNAAGFEATGQLRATRAQSLQQIPGDLSQKTVLRKISLRALEEAIVRQIETGQPLPDVMKYLAGLQQIRYVFVYPETQDIVLAGPGEGWKVDQRGNLVGITTGRPVLLLDDLLVALRTAKQASQGGISCSIDPTAEGLVRLKKYVSRLKPGANIQGTVSEIETTLGPQKITVNGVPATTHFARVLVVADYRMKRLAMEFDPAPIRGLPGYLSMIPATGNGMNNLLPRWWLTAEYQPLLRDVEGMAWELQPTRVKAMTEEDLLGSDGTRQHTGKASVTAQRWADAMTSHYEELSQAEPIFGQLRNCMDLALVGALIAKENLTKKAGYGMPVLLDAKRVELDQFPAPQQVATKASLIEKRSKWIISASGGVQLDSWSGVQKIQTSDAPGTARAKSSSPSGSWWWN